MKIGVLGAGNMGGAILQGLVNKVDPSSLFVLNPVNPRVSELQKKLGFQLFNEPTAFKSQQLDVVIATVPAPVTVTVLKQLNGINPETVIISAAGGIRIKEVKTALPNNPVVAIIPNTPVAINQGTIATTFEQQINEQSKQTANQVLSLLGDVIIASEPKLGIMGTVGGCGPAFVDVFMDAMADAAVEEGLDRKTAYQVIASMVAGSGKLAFNTGKTPADLKDQVTSPGGTTIKGVTELEANGFRNAIIKAIKSSNGSM
ncbi:pyrroline-5-carboxylate reductase (plasmid) [Nicoliella spurrieriana]|uniref:Pyrroline-5-carboxylate reductase n=1 Tax=Nicoliella spurrieriana TaxID=2925830 RepID=A0A976RQS0_9LACO|nr:pyrroline-5-carboxylate reductase [Nicoliella spurrieriana]UQS86150.1 pyrroline-5-carboxylate reductase [Nicoliella spurrieriana]